MFRILTFSCFVFILANGFAQTGKLIVVVKGVKHDKGGDLIADIFGEQNFLKVGKQVMRTIAPASAEQAQLVFDKVKAGTYAITVYQDYDKNRVFKKNMMGYPAEPLGFSNDFNFLKKFRAPTFEEIKIDIPANQVKTIEVLLR